jgi:hypothetical protein
MSIEIDFVNHVFSLISQETQPKTSKHRHYLFSIIFKSTDDSCNIDKIVTIDSNCDVKTITLKKGDLVCGFRPREVSFIKVYWDEMRSLIVDCEIFHKGDNYEFTFQYHEDHFEYKNLEEVLKVITKKGGYL